MRIQETARPPLEPLFEQRLELCLLGVNLRPGNAEWLLLETRMAEAAAAQQEGCDGCRGIAAHLIAAFRIFHRFSSNFVIAYNFEQLMTNTYVA